MKAAQVVLLGERLAKWMHVEATCLPTAWLLPCWPAVVTLVLQPIYPPNPRTTLREGLSVARGVE